MDLGCEKCSHNKVCGKKDRMKETIEALSLNKIYQDLVKHEIIVGLECPYFAEEKMLERSVSGVRVSHSYDREKDPKQS